jgi:hypothetical protein
MHYAEKGTNYSNEVLGIYEHYAIFAWKICILHVPQLSPEHLALIICSLSMLCYVLFYHVACNLKGGSLLLDGTKLGLENIN